MPSTGLLCQDAKLALAVPEGTKILVIKCSHQLSQLIETKECMDDSKIYATLRKYVLGDDSLLSIEVYDN